MRDGAVRHVGAVLHRNQLALTRLQCREQRGEPLCLGLLDRLLLGRVVRQRHGRRGIERFVTLSRAQVVDRDIARDRQQPGRETGKIAAIAMARAPGFLEGSGGEILDVSRMAEPISEEVEHAGQLLRVHLVPIGFRRDPARQPPWQHLHRRHLTLYTAGWRMYHRDRETGTGAREGGVTSPSLGAASVRVQGMRGRYTRFLSDGLPLFGTDVGGLGLLQIPPTDLGQVEVIKGVASALYGAGALGGVVDLISRRPAKEPAREALVNRTSRGGTDATLFAAQPITERWSGTLLVGGHWQQRNDINDDGWADLAGYSRAFVRPRVFWSDGTGRSLFATGGAMWEQRRGGTMPSAVLTPTGAPYLESLDTTRFDGGVVAQMPVAGRYVLTARMSATGKDEDYLRGDVREHDIQDTFFAELAVRGTALRQTWVGGVAFERSTLDPRDEPPFAYQDNVSGVFLQDDIDVQRWLTLSVSGRLDSHSTFGTFVSPRLSTLVREGAWTSRVSIGSGFFAPTALTEETEAADSRASRSMGRSKRSADAARRSTSRALRDR